MTQNVKRVDQQKSQNPNHLSKCKKENKCCVLFNSFAAIDVHHVEHVASIVMQKEKKKAKGPAITGGSHLQTVKPTSNLLEQALQALYGHSNKNKGRCSFSMKIACYLTENDAHFDVILIIR